MTCLEKRNWNCEKVEDVKMQIIKTICARNGGFQIEDILERHCVIEFQRKMWKNL